MPGWMVRTVFLLNSWVIRTLVVFSFAAHVTIVFLAGVRRHKAIGLPIAILWAANQLGRSAATYALSKLALGSTPQELQLVTLWGAFLLLHAAGPDNITAYSLEDNVLSTRQKVEMILQVSGAAFAMYKNIVIRSGSGTMVWVSSFMFIMGIFKYWERAKAMQLANLENLRSSIKKKKETRRRRSLRNIRRPSSSKHDNDKEALLVAHGLLDITKGTFVDSSVNELVSERVLTPFLMSSLLLITSDIARTILLRSSNLELNLHPSSLLNCIEVYSRRVSSHHFSIPSIEPSKELPSLLTLITCHARHKAYNTAELPFILINSLAPLLDIV
ncbi:uncharacterized protein [Oryza sativa Japonica Group]|uniref:uncharacterized protein n=1 Tax=Oryza sativa subsp. japonica TaxID=39947 RepID=UPI000E1BE5BF|nr:uncharacterized protein LOC107280582 [Oryza sativa Japonica Group]